MIDRVATRQWSMRAHRSSNVLLGVGYAISMAGPIIGQHGERPLLPLAINAESLLITTGLTTVAKHGVQRPRPYLYNGDVPSTLYHGRDDRLSFWSGHTASIASFTFSSACMIDRSDADRGTKTAAWAGAVAVPALMGYLRVRAGRHFPTDVLTGFVVGALVGTVVPYIHRADEGNLGN
ncbi:MAG: phosphatase PAP2 family protein [Flavobacteriales bacterium]|nr:phosphatase PAP2 family protein [Flavobacteriales bacterium]